MCSVIWLKLMLAANEVVRCKDVDVLGSCTYGIYKIVDTMSIDLCVIPGDIQY